MGAVVAVVLAAGAGRRMGDRPKALLETDGVSWLARAIRVCEAAGCSSVWVVARPGMAPIRRILDHTPANLVINTDPDRGMFSSAQVALRAALAADPALAGVVLFPVDHPRVQPQTVAALVGAVRLGTNCVCVPSHNGADGHPIAIDAATARALVGLPATFILSDALTLSASVTRVPVDDPGVLHNVNTPSDPPDRALQEVPP